MRIIIIGAGKLGYSIAELLSKEDYDIVVVDKDEDSLEMVKENLDVLTMKANGSSPITMHDPEIKDSDILIAVTNNDEVNMIACILAKKNGIKHTVARIRDIEFLYETKDYLKKQFDIDLILNPEMLTALEINRILMVPAALNVEDFADGKVRLFETKIKKHSPIVNIPLKDLEIPTDILAAMIFRGHQMIIPHGNDCILPFDNAYFVGAPDAIENFSKNLVQQDSTKLKQIMIIGGSRTARFLAYSLDKMDVDVKIVDKNREICDYLAEYLENTTVINGDGTDIDMLTNEGINEADAVACLTNDDNLNLLIALLCKHLGAKKTIVQVSRVEYIDLMEKVGIDIVLSSRFLAASEVLAYVRQGGIVSVSLLEGARAEAIEVIIQKGAPVDGKILMKAGLPRECLVCACVRDGYAYIPKGNTLLSAGDRVIILADKNYTKYVLPYFKK